MGHWILRNPRKLYYWKLPSGDIQLGERTLVMGILNVTPDSFSDGGHYSDPDRAYAHALQMEEQGADIIDIGAESTRPDSARISAEEEWRRLVPILKLLKDKISVPLSLDTYKSEIAERALQYGVQIFNDPTGLTFDPALAKTAADAKAGLILNHMRGLPETWAKLPPLSDPVATISKDLEATTSRARRAGVEKSRLAIDPGIGFGKRKEQNAEILAQLPRLAELGYPVLVGPSRKSFLNQTGEIEALFATAAAVTAAVLNGAHIVRVHDIKQMRAVAQIADEIARLGGSPAAEEERAERPVPRLRPASPTSIEEERPRPPRPPLAKRAPSEPVAPPPPPTREFRGKPERGGPPRGPWRDRPREDRGRGDGRREGRPARDGGRPRKDGPPRPFGRRPPGEGSEGRSPQGRPPQGRPPQGRPRKDGPPRPFGRRPPGEGSEGRPPQGRPPQGKPPRRPFRKRP